MFLFPARCQDLIALAGSAKPAGVVGSLPVSAGFNAHGKVTPHPSAVPEHVSAILGLPYVDAAAIHAARLSCALDTVCGAGGAAMSAVLTALGVDIRSALNVSPTGVFPHPPEPVPAHLGALGHAVQQSGADFGIAVDPDVDRCVLLDEGGRPIGEENTLAIVADLLLNDFAIPSVVVTNLSSSSRLDVVVQRSGRGAVRRAAVGEVNVAAAMLALGAAHGGVPPLSHLVDEENRPLGADGLPLPCALGGEGNGGVMLPELHIGRDAPLAAALVAAWFARRRQEQPKVNFSVAVADRIPQLHIVKEKYPMTPAAAAGFDESLATVAAFYRSLGESYCVSEVDGLRVDHRGGAHAASWWCHVRRSNTEPVFRVIAEAYDESQAQRLARQLADCILHSATDYPK
eukprot:gnl/Ergobibamus_cyprinoides/289.p1 GENE.gnl/Ergobibamus_cyprinoides/289~~gnl/Ergobibamus_cyprinoides/289.p1  ORF type:complete len:402 (+),score=108.44 gnl/Ergobibamus_cyprinoides/289:201-1406(+)